MQRDEQIARACGVTCYTHAVDLKKLRYILGAVCDAADQFDIPVARVRVLEVGCGVGGVALPVAALGACVTGVDLDEPDLTTLRTAARAAALDVDVACADATNYRVSTDVHVAIASEVFEHLAVPQPLAAALSSQVRPGGRLIVTTPNGYGPWEICRSIRLAPRRWNWLRRLFGRSGHEARGREHEQRYTRARLVRMMEISGFRLLEAHNSDFVLTVSRRLRANRWFGALDCKLADLVPHWMASGWYLTFERQVRTAAR